MIAPFVATPQPVLIEVVRSGIVEGRHHGAVAAVDPDGSIAWSVGDVQRAMLPRSCNKPLQAVAMVRAGLRLPAELLALAAASHSGEDFHVDGVRRMLAGAGLGESDLACPSSWPLSDVARNELVRSGGSPSPVLMNCSGKHAAMLATCAERGWPTATYLDPEHPLQRLLREVVEELTGERAAVATDGCGAPLFSASLAGLARAFSRLARGVDGDGRDCAAATAVATAIRRYPAWVSGSDRDELALHRAVPGLVGKAGAESCYAVALPDGRAIAAKVDDGAIRARPVVMAAALRRWGIDAEPGVDTEAVRRTGVCRLLGGTEPVGELRALL